MALSAGDRWLDEGANLLLIGPARHRQEPPVSRHRPGARRERLPRAVPAAPLTWRSACRWPDGSWPWRRPSASWTSSICWVLDDFAYVTRDQAETSVLFELISTRYEQRSMLITANQPFGQWEAIFPDHAMTVAAIDRLVHRATIFELNVESYRRRTAVENKHRRQRAASTPTSHYRHGCRAAGDCAPATKRAVTVGCGAATHGSSLKDLLRSGPEHSVPGRRNRLHTGPSARFSPGRMGHGYPRDLAQTDSSLRMPRLDLRTRRANLRSRRSGNWLPGSAACVSHSGLSILSMRTTIRVPTRRLSAARSQPPTQQFSANEMRIDMVTRF